MLPNYLASIKSSGIYRFVFDKSEMPAPEAEILRLVVGYSEKGPFNTPVYVTNEDEFKKIFGGRSKKLERYGMWFHRMAIQALKAGPILALNLKNFENPFNEGTPGYEAWEDADYNHVDYTTFDPNASIFHLDQGEITTNLQMAIKDIYNTDRFWTLEPEQLEDYVNTHDTEQTPKGYITIAMTDSRETSATVFMRGYEPKGYDVPFMEWYSSVLNGEDLPSYLEGHERDLVSQYFAELYVFKGEFTPEIAASDKLAKFFNVDGTKVSLKPYILNAFGEKVDTLEALASNDASNFINKYQGILLPDFRNANNTVISLDALVNGDNYIHKLMMRFNQDMLYSIEPDGDFQLSDLDTTGWSKGPVLSSADEMMMSIEKVEPIVFVATYVPANDPTETGKWNYNEGEHEGEAADYYQYTDLTGTPDTDTYTLIFGAPDDDQYDMFGTAGIREGDSLYMGGLVHVVNVKDETKTATQYTVESNGQTIDTVYGTQPVITGPIETWTYSYGGNNYRWTTEPDFVSNGTEPETWHVEVNGETVVGLENIESETEPSAEHHEQTWTYDGADYYNEVTSTESEVTYPVYIVQFDKEVNTFTGTIYKCVGSVTATSANVLPLYLNGYVYGNPKPNTTKQYDKLQWQHYMLNALKNYRGLRIALTSRVDLEYRYLIDTFEGFVEAECKAMLSTICKEKDNVFGILNFPQMRNFSKCDYISFRNENNEFDTKYIPMGGNPLKPMSGLFTLPAQENGASWCGFFTALRIRDIDTGVKEDVPSAALVSNNFMTKYSTYYPYTIIAGTNRGVVREQGLIGPDFNFCREDLDNLEPFGVNCMVYVDRKGTCINSNQTAKQNPVTSLSKINVRELVIFLQDEIEKMMYDYHWDFNTPNLRQRIEDRANVILETAKNNGGVYAYRNQCNEQLNTDEVIDNEMLILSTDVESAKGAGKMVQQLTIWRKGGMSSAISEA